VFVDPGAVEVDRSDAAWMMVTTEMPKEAFEAQYPDADAAGVDFSADYTSTLNWYTPETVRVAEYWIKKPVKRTLAQTPEGEAIDITEMPAPMRRLLGVDKRVVDTHEVEMFMVSGAEVLSGPHPFPSKYIPLVPVMGAEVPLEKVRYRFGMVRFARDPQQLYNYYRTASAESIALAPKAPYVATPQMIGPFKQQWDTANRTNRPYLLYQPDPEAPGARPQREHPPETPVALMQEAVRAADDMKATTGIYDAALGAKSNETSGRAILARQQEGDVSNYHYSDNLERALHYAGRILIDLIPKIYDSERVIRIMGDDDEEEFVPINKVMYAVDGTPRMLNDLSAARFDVRVSIGPSYSTRRMESAASMLEFLKVQPAAAPVIGDLIAKNMDFPGAEEVAKRLRNLVPPQVLADPEDPGSQPPPPPDPMSDPSVRADVELKAAQARKAAADARKAELEAEQIAMAGVGPQVTETEIVSPAEQAVSEAGARKALAEARMAELAVEHYQPPAAPAPRE
jgi:hypothetical protein